MKSVSLIGLASQYKVKQLRNELLGNEDKGSIFSKNIVGRIDSENLLRKLVR